ncbi:unnamed protein product [Ranitomeya imitator]|uniref:Uncharacterized protein n=1 Tax=Ranitomeya imitator TaxID=111125 RepID=A0ABN9MH45_9NEOB|nr:unnamed protein product [Ranitomeya imitator]
MEQRSDLVRASSGITSHFFIPSRIKLSTVMLIAKKTLNNGDGLNVLVKRDIVGFRANTVEKIGKNQYRVWPNEMPDALKNAKRAHTIN